MDTDKDTEQRKLPFNLIVGVEDHYMYAEMVHDGDEKSALRLATIVARPLQSNPALKDKWLEIIKEALRVAVKESTGVELVDIRQVVKP
jgi:hypothetical protein